MGIFDGLIDQANQVLTQPGGGGGDVPRNPDGSINWGGGSSDTTYTQQVDSDGSVTGTPGAIYQRSSSGAITVIYRPSSGSGGGGSSSPTNVFVTNNPGELNQDIVSDGSDGFPAGTVYQRNQVTGAVTIKYRPPSSADPRDKNGDMIDDTSNIVLGGFASSKSPTGYFYPGANGSVIPIWPDGSPAGPAMTVDQLGGGGSKQTWTGYGPKGQGTYYLDGPGGTPGTYIGATQNPASSSGGSSGGSYTVSGPRVSSVSSGGSSGGTARDYAAEQAASQAAQAQMQKDAQAFSASQNALDRAQKDQQFQANYGLSVAQFQAQQAKDAAAQRSNDISQFRSAVNDTDPNAVRAWQYGQGIGAGGNLVNRMSEGGDALSPNALAGAAALLGGLRGTPAASLGSWTQSFPGLADMAGGGATGTPAAGTPTTPAPATTVPGLPSGPTPEQVAARAQQDATIQANISANQRGADQQTVSQNNSAITAWYDPANWKNIGNPNPTGGGVDYYQSTITGEKVPATIWAQMLQDNQGAAQKENQYQNFWAGANITAPDNPGSGYNPTYRPQAVDALGQVSGVSSQTFNPYAPNYTGPVAGMSYGNDNVSNPMPTGNLANDNIMNPMPTTTVQGVVPGLAGGGGTAQTNPQPWTPPQVPGVPLLNIDPNATAQAPTAAGYNQTTNNLTNKAWIPGLARGGVAYGTMLVGENGPEIVHAPQGAQVTPISRGMMHGLQRHGMQGYALGTNVFSSPWARFSQPSYATVKPAVTTTAPTSQTTVPALPATTTGSGTTTSPAATSSTSSSSPVSTSASPASTPVGSTTVPALPTTTNNTTTNPATGQTSVGTLSGNYDVTNLTPDQQGLLDEIANFRKNAIVPDLGGNSPYSLAFGATNPYFQDAYYKSQQTKLGIPAAALQWEVEHNRALMPGLSRGQMAVGY